jgi:hypothetical protein
MHLITNKLLKVPCIYSVYPVFHVKHKSLSPDVREPVYHFSPHGSEVSVPRKAFI